MNQIQIRLKIVLSLLVVLTLCSCSYFQTQTDGNQFASENKNTIDLSAESDLPEDDLTDTSTDETSEVKSDAIYIIFDASGSMWGLLKNKSRKIDVAKNVLIDFVGGDFSGYELAFRAYGHRHKDDCEDTELIVPFGKPDEAISPMKNFVGKVNPLGRTPITYSLRQALKDFGDRSGEIILISDGIESCNADPCALIREWRKSNVKIKVHVVGFGLDEKSKSTLKCISDAAGTEYYDAQSAESLADALKKIKDKATSSGFGLKGFDPAGNPIRVQGTLSQNGKIRYKVSSNGRFQIEEGEYELQAGVPTINGNIYKPVTKKVNVKATGETSVKVTVPVPPRVKAEYVDSEGDKKTGGVVTVWKNGKNIARFRQIDEVFIDEGTFEFRAFPTGFGVNPPKSSQVSVKESFSIGDRKKIVFKFARAVRVTLRLKAKGTNERMPGLLELWQNGEKKYTVNTSRSVYPGTYTLVYPNSLTPFEKKNVVITNQAKQTFEYEVPVGFVTFIYQKSDGSRDKDARVFVGRSEGRRTTFKVSGKPIPLTSGKYFVKGWRQKGNYEDVTFSVKEGERKQVFLRAK